MSLLFSENEHRVSQHPARGRGIAVELDGGEVADFLALASAWVRDNGGTPLGHRDRLYTYASPGTPLDPFSVVVYPEPALRGLVFDARSGDYLYEIFLDSSERARGYLLLILGREGPPDSAVAAVDTLLRLLASGGKTAAAGPPASGDLGSPADSIRDE